MHYTTTLLLLLLLSAALPAQLANGDFEAPRDTAWELGSDQQPVTIVDNPEGAGQVLLLESSTPSGAFVSQLAPLRTDSLTLYQVSFRVRTALKKEASTHLWVNVLGPDGEKLLANQYPPSQVTAIGRSSVTPSWPPRLPVRYASAARWEGWEKCGMTTLSSKPHH